MNKYMSFIREKKEVLDAYRRVQPHPTPIFDQWSKLEFVYISNLVSGGQLSRIEINQLIEKGLTIGGRALTEQNSVVSDALAIDWIRQSATLTRYDVNEQLLISLHHLPNFTEKETGFLKYTYQAPYVLTEYTEWLHQQKLPEVEVSVAAYLKLLEIKPFKDANPRTALLLMNLLLLMEGYPLAVIQEKNIEEYKTGIDEVLRGGSKDSLSAILFEAISFSLEKAVSEIEKKGKSDNQHLLKIGQLAKITNETIPTIRHWTKQGLLQVSGLSQGGYQLYSPKMAEVVLKIRELQREERMTVREIKEVIDKFSLVK